MSDERNAKLRTDNGGEYVSKDFDNYFTSKGVEHQLTIPHSPQQYTVAERLNCTTRIGLVLIITFKAAQQIVG